MKKIQVTKNILYVLASLFVFVLNFICFIKSYGFEDYGEYGVDISFNEDYGVAMAVSLIVVVFTIYALIAVINNKKVEGGLIVGFTSTLVISFYTLGTFFKVLSKANLNSEIFDFQSYQNYLWVGIFTLILLVCFTLGLIQEYKSKQEIK